MAERNVFLLGLSVLLTSCGSCSESTVPFGLDSGPPVAAHPDPGEATPTNRPPGRAFPDGTRRVDVEGAAIEVDGSVRALWTDDIDGDRDRDAVVLANDAQGAVRVSFYRRDGARFAAPRALASTTMQTGCTIGEAALSPLGAEWLVARAQIACEASPVASRREFFILAIESTPRMLEHLALLSPEGRTPGELSLELTSTDRDADGNADLVAMLTYRNEGEPAELSLPWLDRPSGLARDPAEPERTFDERSREALRALRRDPAGAAERSLSVLSLHEVLCREPGRARLRVGDTDGLGCGSSEGAGRASTTLVRAHAQRGQLLEALAALARMSTPGLRINDERRQAARDALAHAPASRGVTMREGPAFSAPSWSARHLSALAFLDDDHLLLRGETPRVWNLGSGAEEPATAAQGELRILDPNGAFAVVGVERRCAGQVLRIVRAQSIVAGQAMGTHSLPLLAAREPPAGAPCPDLTPALRRDDGGFRVLGWAPQGVVAARGEQIVVVPLDENAQPAGSPNTLADGTLPPAPLPAGAIASDGRYFVELRDLGVVVHRLAPQRETSLFWPAGWGERAGSIDDPAVSPSGRRAAVVRGGRVLLLERR